MSPRSTITVARPSLTAPPSSAVLGVALAVVVLVAAFVLVAPALRTPGSIEAIEVHNPYPWRADIRLVHTDGSRLFLGSVPRESDITFHRVIDSGDTFQFDFAYEEQATRVETSRADLADADWVVDVPPQLAADLAAHHVAETPD
jgi:hypothetical protein